MALDTIDLQFAYDIVNGTGNPGDVEMMSADLIGTGACTPNPCGRTQIRKVNVSLTGRRRTRCRRGLVFLRNTLESQVSLRGMAFVDQYRYRPPCNPLRRGIAMRPSVKSNESGMAIITALLVLMLASGLMAGMFAALIADQRSHATDRDQSMAYAAAHAGLEKLTSSLARCFDADFSPSAAQVGLIDNTPPTIPGFQFTVAGRRRRLRLPDPLHARPRARPQHRQPAGHRGATSRPATANGLQGLITPYTITVTARSSTGNSEVRLRRELQTVAVPVFQFGIFGEKTLGFHAGPNFDFGGRVHTNASLYLASGDGSTLTFRDKITAFTQVERDTLHERRRDHHDRPHGRRVECRRHRRRYRPTATSLATESSGTRRRRASGRFDGQPVRTGGRTCRIHRCNGYTTNIRTEATGAKQLNLPLAHAGAQPIDLMRRPVVQCRTRTRPTRGLRPALLRAGQPADPALGSARRTSPTCRRSTGAPIASCTGRRCSARAAVGGAGRARHVVGAGHGEPGAMTTGVGHRRAHGHADAAGPRTNGGGACGDPDGCRNRTWLKSDQIRSRGSTGTLVHLHRHDRRRSSRAATRSRPLANRRRHRGVRRRRRIRLRSRTDDHRRRSTTRRRQPTRSTSRTSPSPTASWRTRMFFVGEDPVTCTGFTATAR